VLQSNDANLFSSKENLADGTGLTALQLLMDVRLWIACIVFALVGVLGLNEVMLYSPDSPRYIAWAKSLAAFQGYVDASGPITVHYVVHAPFYSIVLAPLAWVFRNIIIPAKILTLATGVALLVLFYLWTARKTGKGPALVGVYFLAINPLIILFAGNVLSDIPFTACLVLFFMLAEKMQENPQSEKLGWWLVLVLTVGIFLREIGMTLLLGAMSYFIVTKQYRRLLLIFTIPMLFYLLWYFRNEVYYAAQENPSLRNMKLFLGNYYTVAGSGLIEEFVARLKANFVTYLNMGKGLILFPQYLVFPYAVVADMNHLMAPVTKTLRIVQYPLILLQYGLFAWGLIVRWKQDRTTILIVLVSGFYLSMVYLYPINDIRFLVPILIPILHLCVIGGHDIARRISRRFHRRKLFLVFAGIAGLFLALPNAVWSYNYDAYNLQTKNYPSREVGRWIAEHSDSSTIVLSRWQEISLWLDGRKMIISDHLVSLTTFDDFLRDFHIGYVVSYVTDPGFREFEFQMIETKKFAFTSVYRVGPIEVMQVHDLNQSGQRGREFPSIALESSSDSIPKREIDARAFFKKGIEALDAGQSEEAINIFTALLQVSQGSGYVGFFCGISLETVGQYKAALKLYEQLRQQFQAGPFIVHARYHTSLVNQLQDAERDTSKVMRASLYQTVSSSYWDIGFHRYALELLKKSFHEDSTFVPSFVFGMYYSAQLGDTVAAKRYFSQLKKASPQHAIVQLAQNVFDAMDAARNARSSSERLEYQLKVARAYDELGLTNASIDEIYRVLDADPANAQALEMLSDAYLKRNRRWPAFQVLKQLVKLRPDDEGARLALEKLQEQM
jgi:tetratricopeptide (TPR) repeat protein/4-amino-4-deoxy-L-arabinose transferase-like glycosyltransferase